ncbi:MAG: hypothetical protein LBB85_03485 [Dysgonamonadaceae bacterium]|jgi:hypothetical protein|nr:hypothetical protein [Dysgonamonadaceae bacterium]
MKKNLLTFAFILSLTVSVSSKEKGVDRDDVIAEEHTDATAVQEEPESGSWVILDGSPYDFIFSWKKKAKESHWTGFGFAFSNLKGLGNVDLDLSRSYSMVLNVGDYIVPLNQNWLMITGWGFDWSRYHFRGNQSVRAVDGTTLFLPDPEDREYRDSKLLVYYATLPVLLEYQMKWNSRQMFFVYGGVEGLVKLYSKSQAEIRTPNGIKKEIYKGLDLLPLNFRFAGRIGFRDFSIFGYYQPLSLFEKGNGPDIHPYGLGLMLNF